MPLREDLLNPIPGESPAGANLRYDPVTDKIKEARREDLDLDQGVWKTALKTADWPAVIKMAGEAIAKRGKDLQIAVWLVDAQIRKDGFSALAPCFQFLHDLLEQYWDVLYPPIDEDGDMEVRSAPLVWLGSKLNEPLGFLPIVSNKLSWNKYQESRKVGYEADADTGEKQDARAQAIKEGKTTGDEFDAAAEATSTDQLRDTFKNLNLGKAALEELSNFCDTQFGDFSPSFIKTRDAIDEIAQTVRILLSKRPGGLEEDAPAVDDDFSMGLSTDTEASGEAEVAAVQEAVAAAPAAVAEDTGGDVGRQLAAICRTLRSRDQEDASPYLILRSFAWAPVMYRAPMLDRDSIVPPESDLRVKLKRLTADSEWDKVLELTEANMLRPCAKYWLDLQRYAVNALEQRGNLAVSKVVVNQFRVLLELLPDLVDITFPDDTPAANGETKEWITNFVIFQKMPPRESTEGSESSESSGESDSSSSDFSFDTSSFDSSSLETPAEETPSFDMSSWDSTPSTPEPQAASTA